MTDSTPIVPFGGLHGSGNDKPQFEIIAALKRELAAAKERSKVMEDWAQQEAALRDAAEAERDALRMDAERYRWLRENWFAMGTLANKLTAPGCHYHAIGRAADVESVDAAIDAAMKEEA
mgnify:CR=1 FL=1